MERRGFLGKVGATIAALLIPWKDVPDFQPQGESKTGAEIIHGPKFGAIHVPAEPVPRQVNFSYKDHPTVEGPTIPAGRGMDIPFADQEELTGIEVIYPEDTPAPGEHVEYEVKHATS